jgi:hypothetical protein
MCADTADAAAIGSGMHASACLDAAMTTSIQVRGVVERLAAAAKARADATHRSLSAYIRDLIERDLAESDSRLAMRRLLPEIADDPRPRVSRETTAAALAQVRGEVGVMRSSSTRRLGSVVLTACAASSCVFRSG